MDDEVKFVDPARKNYELLMKICASATSSKRKLIALKEN